MRVVGLITEYNPFHNGHLHHIKRAKSITQSDYCVVVMSGNYVQRGEPAIIDKWTRTKIALHSGADMVIEIPTVFSTSSAEYFAMASIALLEATGIVDYVCFGSELGEIAPLAYLADLLTNESVAYQALLGKFLGQGLNFPVARANALKQLTNQDLHDVIACPNNILGVEYLKALRRINSNIEPFTIKREGAGYHDLSTNLKMASASAIRNLISHRGYTKEIEDLMPKQSAHLVMEVISNNSAPLFYEDFFHLLKYRILLSDANAIKEIQDVSEGFEHRIISNITKVSSMKALISNLSTKRFTLTRVQRALMHILLDITKSDFKIYTDSGYVQYLKVLGFKNDSKLLMQEMKKSSKLPIIVNVKDSVDSLGYIAHKMLTDEIISTNIYNIAINEKFNQSVKNDYTQPIIIV